MTFVRKIFILVIFLANLPFAGHQARAATKPEVISRDLAHMEMFMLGQYKDLDREMNAIQIEFENKKWDDVDLVIMMQYPFLSPEPMFDDKYKAWLTEYPQSYAAHQAHVIYYTALAVRKLNGHRPDQLSPQELSEVKHNAELAIDEGTAALKLASKPLTTYFSLIYLYALTDAWDKSRQMLEEADKVSPKNTSARYQYISAMVQFGRPLKEISEFVNEVRKSGLPRKYMSDYDNVLHRRLLNEGQYDQLDVEMNQVQQDYEAGKIDDRLLDSYFEIFANTNPTLEAVYNAWIEAHPKSYAARQARALYYSQIAMNARGVKYASDTSGQEMASMAHYMDQAFEDDRAAMGMTAKPIIVIDNMMTIEEFSGTHKAIAEFMTLANKIDPKNSIVRHTFMHTLQTRWGGSLEAMEKFLNETKAAGLSADDISDFEDMIITEKLWLANRKADEYENIGKLQTGF